MSEHIVSKKTYYTVFFALMLGTALTVAAAFVNLHSFNIVVALLIAGVKATLVIFFFMHVKYSSRLTKLWVAVGFIWLFLMLAITMTDYLSRAWLTYKP
ncbi:MAG: cytochrome C oxidase subunit IV family protein [Bacteroidota bacterium]|nr:cytochrome C oxidase subunit IV family protein [Bacteroidota bacterium]MDP4234627.1 cytochrome C oxidase subunit IV family protein [Bacteroidota bacterium]MDP4243774.1 cytochrome C oxidase subunit IV family protein [Bacteroidota bacterium]MDP4288988.1 cytochrome C oxidase subunit IV family protein [Bacteroidota bacterium]